MNTFRMAKSQFMVSLVIFFASLCTNGNSAVVYGVSKINNASGFFLAGGKEYHDLLFFVTAKSVVKGVKVSSISIEAHMEEIGSNVDSDNFGKNIFQVSDWYFHPNDTDDDSSANRDETNNVAVAIVHSSHSLYQAGVKIALPIRTLGEFKVIPGHENVEIMTLDGLKTVRVFSNLGEKVSLKDNAEQKRKSKSGISDKGGVNLLAYNIIESDIGSPILSYSETKEMSGKSVAQRIPPLPGTIYGFFSGINIDGMESKYGRSVGSKSGILMDIVTCQEIKDTINQAFFNWQTSQ